MKHFDWWVFTTLPETNINIPETNISPENRRLEKEIPNLETISLNLKVDGWKTTVLRFLLGFDLEFQVRVVSFREGILSCQINDGHMYHPNRLS